MIRVKRYWFESSKFVAAVVVVLIFTLFLSFLTFFKLREYVDRVNALEGKIAKLRSEMNERIGRVEDLIGPNSPLDHYINDVNFLKNMLGDLKVVERILSDLPGDPTRGYFRVLVVGTEKVWFEVDHGRRKIFASELFPGLSPYKFYYFKPPMASLDYIVSVPPDSSVIVGKPGRVFLIFFGVGTHRARPVKIVKLSNTKYVNLQKSFNLYIPK